MAPMNREASGSSLFLGKGMSRHIMFLGLRIRRLFGIHRNMDDPAHCIHRNKDEPAHCIHSRHILIPMNTMRWMHPYSYEYITISMNTMRQLIPIPMNRDEPGASLFIGAMNEIFPMSALGIKNISEQ